MRGVVRETARGAALRWRRHSNTDLQLLLLRPTCSELLAAHKETAAATCAPTHSPPVYATPAPASPAPAAYLLLPIYSPDLSPWTVIRQSPPPTSTGR